MHGRKKRRISAQTAFLFLATGLQADISLPLQAPPQAEPQLARVWRGGQTTIPLRAHYGGGGIISFGIVQKPEHGHLSELRLRSDNRATILYENDGQESVSSDGFRYTVKAGGDRTSSPAEVRITVEEPPARIMVPGIIAFDEIMAGESKIRPLTIKNEGGGVLAGRISVSAPWQLALTEYRVKSGQTEVVDLSFWPDEGREYVGQVTLIGTNGAQTSVQLAGTAIAPIRVEPEHLQIDPPQAENGSRVGLVSLQNQTERALRLKIEATPNIQPVPEIALAPHEKKQISIVIALHREVPLHEEIRFVGAGFRTRLQIDAEAALPPPRAAGGGAGSTELSSVSSPPALSATPTPKRQQSEPIAIRSDAATSLPLPAANGASGVVHVRRPDATHWELRWAQPKTAPAKYRIDERFLSLDSAGVLQTSWRALPPRDTTESGDEVVAQIKGLDPTRLHMLRVIALGPDGGGLWESPPTALAPPREPSRSEGGWLLVFGLALLVFLFVRWRASRAQA